MTSPNVSLDMITAWYTANNIPCDILFAVNVFKKASWPIGKTNETVNRWITREGKILRAAPTNPDEAYLVNVDAWNACLGSATLVDTVKKNALSALFFSIVSNMRIQAKIDILMKSGVMTELSQKEFLAYVGHLAWCLANPDAVVNDDVCKLLTERSGGESAVMPDGSFSAVYREAYLSVYRGESRPSGMNYDLEAVELYLSATQ